MCVYALVVHRNRERDGGGEGICSRTSESLSSILATGSSKCVKLGGKHNSHLCGGRGCEAWSPRRPSLQFSLSLALKLCQIVREVPTRKPNLISIPFHVFIITRAPVVMQFRARPAPAVLLSPPSYDNLFNASSPLPLLSSEAAAASSSPPALLPKRRQMN